MSSIWDTYPTDYRSQEVESIISAVKAGECVSLVGLGGSGKSNLLGFLAHRHSRAETGLEMVLVDCNRLSESSPGAFFGLIQRSLGNDAEAVDEVAVLEEIISKRLASSNFLCLLIDRFEVLTGSEQGGIYGNLRALRDAHKYALTYVIATRRPLDPHSELAELFYANTLWLGPMSESDARWNVTRYADRKGLHWDEKAVQEIVRLSWGYPSLLRAICEAYADGTSLDVPSLVEHQAVHRRVAEFWADGPGEEELRHSRLEGQPILGISRSPVAFDSSTLTAKEHKLWEYLLAHPGEVCEKDELIRAVWPEDKIYEQGIRDDSLAQLVRRLREKVELDASKPRYIQTVSGRGYRLMTS
jgi:ABC-type dipeptide/oligopeptide/nickel transport system ATPase subunit